MVQIIKHRRLRPRSRGGDLGVADLSGNGNEILRHRREEEVRDMVWRQARVPHLLQPPVVRIRQINPARRECRSRARPARDLPGLPEITHREGAEIAGPLDRLVDQVVLERLRPRSPYRSAGHTADRVVGIRNGAVRERAGFHIRPQGVERTDRVIGVLRGARAVGHRSPGGEIRIVGEADVRRGGAGVDDGAQVVVVGACKYFRDSNRNKLRPHR